MHSVEEIKIPIGVAVRVDDVGWLEGNDDRCSNRPARSGLPRRHVADDVRVIHEIGKGLGVKILCNIVLGDWDIKNRLRGVPNLTWNEKGWDCASVIAANRAHFEETFDVLEGSEYIEYGLHGLQHAYFENDLLVDAKYLYPLRGVNENGQKVRVPLSEEEFSLLLDLFYEIYNDWGFKKTIRVYQAGCGCIGTVYDEYNRTFARLLRDRGIGIWEWGGWPAPLIEHEGTLFVKTVTGKNFLEWNMIGADPRFIKDCFGPEALGEFCPNICGHLANFVQLHPEKNFDYVPYWIDYFRRVTSNFGGMLARDNEESASQSAYAKYATVDTVDGGYRIDLAPLDAVRTFLVEDEFYVSLKDKALPRAVIGGAASVHECRADHAVYKIRRDAGADSVTILM